MTCDAKNHVRFFTMQSVLKISVNLKLEIARDGAKPCTLSVNDNRRLASTLHQDQHTIDKEPPTLLKGLMLIG